eukprot:13735505-Alexandrium_andersonii.AAC.1
MRCKSTVLGLLLIYLLVGGRELRFARLRMLDALVEELAIGVFRDDPGGALLVLALHLVDLRIDRHYR